MAAVIWSIDAVEEALIACHELWWRSPGDGRWPFAADGPWHLQQREDGDYAGDGKDGASSSARPRTPLGSAEVDERDRVTAWLQLLPDPVERAIVHRATLALWRGESRPPWKVIKRELRWARTTAAMSMRYSKALALIACRLNGWPSRKARQMAETWRRYQPWQGVPEAFAEGNSAGPTIANSLIDDQES